MRKHATKELQIPVHIELGISSSAKMSLNSTVTQGAKSAGWVTHYLDKLDLHGRGIHSFKLVGQISCIGTIIYHMLEA